LDERLLGNPCRNWVLRKNCFFGKYCDTYIEEKTEVSARLVAVPESRGVELTYRKNKK